MKIRHLPLWLGVFVVFLDVASAFAQDEESMKITPEIRGKLNQELGGEKLAPDIPAPTQLEQSASQKVTDRASRLSNDFAEGRGEINRSLANQKKKDLKAYDRLNASLDDAWKETEGWSKEMERREETGKSSVLLPFLIILGLGAGGYFFFMNRYLDS